MGSVDPPVPVSSVVFVSARFFGKNRSEKSEKPDNRSAISNVRWAGGGGGDAPDAATGPVEIIVLAAEAVGGIAAVASGRTPIVGGVSTGRRRAGFLINDKNRC